jgi:hypothetical protein
LKILLAPHGIHHNTETQPGTSGSCL